MAKLKTTAELCEELNIHRMTLIRWRRELGFPEPVQWGGPTSPNRYDDEEVQAWLEIRSRRHKLTQRPPSQEGTHPDAGEQAPPPAE
jgi:hypothetical protein